MKTPLNREGDENKMKYTLQWTNALGKTRHFKKPLGRGELCWNIRKLVTKKRVKKTHATIITIVLSQETENRKLAAEALMK